MVQPIFPSVKPSGISAVPEDFTALLKRLYPDKLQPLSTARQDLFYTKYQEYGGILDIPTWTLAGAPLHPEDEFNYLVDLPSRATLKEGETILRGLNIPETGIDEFYGIETRQNELETLVKKTFPQYNLEGFTKWTESFETSPENWGKFINTIQTGGWTKDKEDLLHLFDFTTEAINEMLPSPQISPPTAAFEAEWMNVKTGEYITSTELHRRYPKGYEAELDLWKRSPEQVRETVKALPATLTIFGQALTKVPKQVGASILQAIQGQGGASVVDKDWADRFIEEAGTDIGTFVKEIQEKYPERGGLIKYEDLAQLPQNISYSLTSMGAGLAAGIPTALIPLPGMRVAAWALGTAASGAVAYSMTTYQIMQQYLEAKNEESIATKGRGITLQEENQLKADFESKARKYGLWEAVPEAISNLAFAKLLTTPLTKMVGRTIATKIVGKLVGIYGEEILTETITQKGQSDIEVEAGLREGRLTLVEAFKEIAPQTFLLTTIMGGAGQVGVSGYNRVKASLKTEVGETHPLYQTLVTALRDETGGLKLPKGKPEVPTVPEKPALVAQPSQEWSRLSTSNRVKLIQSIPVEERTKIGLTTGDANVAWNKLSPEKKQAIRSKIVLTIPEKVIAKQPWQMTYREFYPIAGSEYTSGERFGIPTVNKVPAQPGTKFGEKGATPEERIHRAILRKALSEGKPVPAEVLKDYPDLKPAPTPTTGAVVEPTAKVTPTPEVTTYKKGQTVEWWDGRAGGKWVEGKINSVDIEADRVNITSGGKKFNVNIGNMLRAKAEAAIPKAEIGMPEAERLAKIDYFRKQATKWRETAVKISEQGENYRGGLKKGEVAYATAIKRADEFDTQARELEVAPEVPTAPPTVEEVARIKELTEAPVTLEKEVKDTSDLIKVRGEPLYTIEQIDALSGVVGEYLVKPNPIYAYQVVRQYQALERARRFENVANRRKELIVTEGLSWEEAHNKAMDEFARGKLPTLTIEGLQGITDELRDVFFAKVHHTFDQLGNRYEGERWATITALTNALAGTSIPMDRGKGSLLFPEGGSAWDRLNYVFGKQPKLMEGLTKTAEQKQSLKDVVQGIFREVPEGGMPPIAIDQKTADYLRRLAEIPMGQARLGEKPFVLPSLPVDTRTPAQKAIDLQNFKLELTPALWKDWTPQRLEEMSYLRINLLKTEYQTKLAEAGWTPPSTIADQRTPAQRALDLDLFKIEMAIPPEVLAPTKYVFEAPIEDAIKQIPLLPRPAKDNVVRALKEIGMLPVDIGNFLRANKASFDFSFWRQQAPLIAGHPISFVQANIEAWKALWSQKSAEASWVKITRDPLYQIYEECERNGGDFIRPLELKKGTAQWRGVEEYGYLTGERVLPKLTAKIPWIKLSARSFETGTNVHNWLIFKNYYNAMLKYSEQIASGKKTLKVGEAFDISKEMVDFSKSLANFTARGSLGKFAVTAPELSGLFFAPRAAIGRILSVKDLVNANPRVRLEAWKNAATFVSTFGGLVLLGAAVGWWDVEKDPRSAEYMSIRIGNTRIDPWGGFRQFLVFFTRAITGTGVSSVTGAKYKTDPLGLIQNLLVGKASPLASTILDFWRGKNFVGEEVDVANKKQWVERVAPFALWDIYEAYQDDPIHVLQIAIPAIVGAGVQTYTGDWKDNFPKLGLPKYSDNLAYGLVEPKYDTSDLWTDTSSQFKGVDPATLTEAKGFPPYIKAIAESRIINEYLATLPSEKLVNLNADPSKGITFTQYYQMWRDRQAIVTSGDEEKLADFDKDERTRNANLGNFSQRQFALLNEYWSITDKNKQAEFLKLHQAEIGIKARDEYLRTHPKENAQLAVWGQADILTREAYTLFNTMIKSLDIPDSAIPPLTLPPETSIESHFTYKEMVSQGKQGSWEAQLLLKQDAIKAKDSGAQSYADWAGLKLSDTPMASLEIKTKPEFRELYDKIQDLSDRTSPDYIADDKARAEAIKKLKADNPNYVDDTRRIEAIEKGTDQSPIDDALITAHVAYGKLIDKEGIGSSSAEVMLYRVDEPSYNTWRMDANVWGDNALKPIDESRIPIWRIDVKYAKEDAAYDALPTTGTDREDYLTNNLEYRMDRRRREAYQKGLDAGLIEPYVSYCELPITGYRRDRFLLNNPDFANALKLTIPDIVPSEQYDILLEKKDRTPQDELRMDAYKLYVPDEQIENYVGWNTIIGEGRPKLRPGEKDAGYYEDNWWMMEHLDYYQQVYLNKNIYPDHQRMDFRKVPTKKVYAKYWTYLNELSEGKPREDYRRGNPDLEEWLLLTGKVTQSITEKARRAELSPAERLAEEVADRLKRIRELSEPLALK